jgi:Glycine-zipper domain
MSKLTFSLSTALALSLIATSAPVRSQNHPPGATYPGGPPPIAGAPPPNTQVATSSASPASQLGVYPFPAKGQSGEQQQIDQLHCYDWAKNQTHLDPLAQPSSPPVAVNSPPPSNPPPTGRTAARGAAGGAVVGAIFGRPGAGAAAGATAGAIRGSNQNRAADEQQAAQQQAVSDAQQQANEQAAAQRHQFNSAFSACLTGKGYTVK